MFNFKAYNAADWFSFYRIVMGPVLILLIFFDQRMAFSWMLLLSFASDGIDGFLARNFNMASERGATLDSIGDQITFFVAVLGLIVFEPGFIKENHLIIIIALIPYFFQTVMAYFKYGKLTSFHTYLAKITAILQAFFIVIILFFGPINWLFYTMIAFGLVEILEEIILVFMYDHWVSDVRGIYWALKDPRRKRK